MTDRPADDRRWLQRISRRRFLAASGVTTAGLAGCLTSGDDSSDENDGEEPEDEPDDTGDPQEPVPIEELPGPGTTLDDPPDHVYLPSHQESFKMLPIEEVGDYMLMPHYTYAHAFWLLSDDGTVKEDPKSQMLHFMFAFWDSETGQVLPVDVAGPVRVYRDGEIVDGPRAPWPMISQRMGFHFGDNIRFASDQHEGPYPEEGTYEIEIQLQPISARKTGAFAGRFEDPVSTTFEFEFVSEDLEQLNNEIEYFDEERWGERDAVPLLGQGGGDGGGHGTPEMKLPPAENYPGETLGRSSNGDLPSSHDAEFVVQYIQDASLAEDASDYLLVSPRTPYNRIPLPNTSLSVSGAIDGQLTATLDSELGHHYGTSVDLPVGEPFDLIVDSPPQVSRHRGYQTAFLDMPAMTIER